MSNAISLRVPKYRHHKPSRQAVVTLHGKDYYLGRHNSPRSHEAYRRLIAEWSTGGISHPRHDAPTVVAEIMVGYLRFAKGYYRKDGKPTREYELIREVCRFIRPLYSRWPVSDFGPLALKAIRQSMIEAGHSRSFINNNVNRIRRMFKWAAAEELVPASIPQALSMVSGLRKGRSEARETKPIFPVDDTVVESTLVHLPVAVADMVRLQRLTGMRPAEVCLLRPCDLDLSGDGRRVDVAANLGSQFQDENYGAQL